MGFLRRKSEVDKKLRRGEPVTTEEIVEAYARYERTPWGSLTPAPESMQLVAKKAAEAERRGLLIHRQEGDPGTSAARLAALELLDAQDSIVAEGLAKDVGALTPAGAGAYVLMTETQLAWALVDHPDAAAAMRFDQIVRFGGQAEHGRLNLTERDASYAASLDDPANPFGETDASLEFSDLDLLEAIVSRLMLVNEARMRSVLARFAAMEGKPVAIWEECPVCQPRITLRVEHGAMCTTCSRCYTDANFQPVPSDAADSYGLLSRTEPWRPLMETQVAYRDRTLVWVARPPGQAIKVRHSSWNLTCWTRSPREGRGGAQPVPFSAPALSYPADARPTPGRRIAPLVRETAMPRLTPHPAPQTQDRLIVDE